MSSRKYKSGAEQRKLQLDKEKENINVKNFNFFKITGKSNQSEQNVTKPLVTSDKNVKDFENLKKTSDETEQGFDYQESSSSTLSKNNFDVQQKDENTDAVFFLKKYI